MIVWLRRCSVVFWLVPVALLLEDFFSLTWWHPYCNLPSDGPGYFARGFPLPYAELTGGVSLDLWVMPHVLLFNLAVIGLAILPIVLLLIRHASRTVAMAWVLTGVGGVVFIVVVGYWVLGATAFFVPVRSIAWPNYDGYWSYRPYFLVRTHGATACDM